MKRPYAGLLATAAAVPGVWLLASAEEAPSPGAPALEPDPGEVAQSMPDPAQRLAAVTPTFGGAEPVLEAVETPPSPPADLLSEVKVSTAHPLADANPVAAVPAATLAKAAEPQPVMRGPEFVAKPVIQPLPVVVPEAAPAPKPVKPPAAALAQVDAPPPAPIKAAPAAKFVAEPVVQRIAPPPMAQAAAEAPQPKLPQRIERTAFVSKAVVQALPIAAAPTPKAPEAVVTPAPPPARAEIIAPPPAKALPAFVAAPVIQALTAKQPVAVAVLSLPKPTPQAPKAAPAIKRVIAAPEPKPAVQAAPVKPAPKVLAAATPPVPKPVATAKPPATAPAPASAPAPRAKLPVGEVVLASFSPAPAVAAPVTPAPPRQVETTAAKTVPVGTPERVTYPEPAFGPPEARFIPAALTSVEPPEQPTSLGSASTLAQAIAYSYETNPRLLAERASNRSADLGYPAARAAFGPRLDASASLSYTRDRDEILPGSFLRQQGWSDTASLILSQPLLTFGRSQAQVGQAAANIDYRRESLRLVQNEVMLDVIAAYVGTLREAGAVTIARENVALLQRQLEESNARFAVREITLADVQQVETRLALGKTVLLDAQARLGEIHSRFYRAVGMPPGELAPPEPLTLPVSSLPEAYSLADNQSPLVRAAQARERISRAFLAGTRAGAAPRVDFRGSADYGAMSDYSRDLRGTRVRGTVTVSVPLFDSGARSAESGQARETNSADLQLIAAAQRDSRTAVATGWNNVLAARLSIDHYRQAVESAQRAYENAQRQERAGMRTTLDVLDLARDLLNVRNAYNAALADEYQARATLLATLGQLDPDKMSDGIKLYDPADHFRKVKSKGDIPLLTGSLAALDGVVLPNLKANKPSTDAAAMVGTAETVTGK
jgi:TolC family type I secretion outer membrane protein